MAGRFQAVPQIPSGLADWQGLLFTSIKENVELLTATRGESDLASRAIVRGDFTVNQVGTQVMVQVNTNSNTTPVSLATAAPLNGFTDLRQDVQTLAEDLIRTRSALDLLISNLKEG